MYVYRWTFRIDWQDSDEEESGEEEVDEAIEEDVDEKMNQVRTFIDCFLAVLSRSFSPIFAIFGDGR